MRRFRPDLGCSATIVMLCYILVARLVFTNVQNFVKNTEQMLFCFTSRIVHEIACSRHKALPSNILLVISGLKSLISQTSTSPYFFCPGCTIVQQHTHCRNFIHFTLFFFSSCHSHPPLLNRLNNILQTGDHDFTEDIPLCLFT
jgi:hypothetical protein